MAAQDCGHHDDDEQRVKRITIAIVGFFVVFGIVVFLVWAILHPDKPRFILQDVTIYAFNLTATNLLQTSKSLSSHNPNDKIGIYYQKLDIFASYHNQQITLPTLLPRTYQGHLVVTVWSPFFIRQCGAGGAVSGRRVEPGLEYWHGDAQCHGLRATEMGSGDLGFGEVSNKRQLSGLYFLFRSN
ncbi:putative CCR4-associated factor 1-8 [Hibiscus syriacus]|uniref:CCR4-associated factor 1-8 n=1 Tax=Hibiscus syriacus TaxID=106335 RepID=A0A6A2XE63_HIBSY|nr:putative CCR4-associated factor 1-8 [Hibiscus syriacus]